MNRIYYLFLGVVSLIMFSCSKEMKDPTDNSFAGVWVLSKLYSSESDTMARRPMFVSIREESNMMMFFTGGVYDSSFLYQVDGNNKVTLNRIQDSTPVKVSYPVRDTLGNIVYGSDGKIQYFEVLEVKPLMPVDNPVVTNKIVSASFDFEGNTMIFRKYRDQQSSVLDRKYIFVRGKE